MTTDSTVQLRATILERGERCYLVTETELRRFIHEQSAAVLAGHAKVVQRALLQDLLDAGVLVSDAQARLVQQAAEAAAQRAIGTVPEVQDVRIVELPPLAAQVVRDGSGKMVGLVDAE